MQAIRVHPAPAGTEPYSASNPAPVSALHLDPDVMVPKPSSQPGEVLVRVKASTVVRDTLTWPDTYTQANWIPGNDLAGVVVEVASAGSKFSPGDEVFGMVSSVRSAAWAEYVVVKDDEIAPKPKTLTWEQAAAMPLSGQTAYEALVDHAGISLPARDEEIIRNISKSHPAPHRKRILITGAAGGVGVYLVQLAAFAGLHVTGATSSNSRNSDFLRSLGADETIEYASLKCLRGMYDVVIDTVGGEPLADAWTVVKSGGTVISVDSSSFDFVQKHKEIGLAKEGVKGLFFIVHGRSEALNSLARLAESGLLEVFVLYIFPATQAREAYERASGRVTGRGKVILTF
ncbi:hypothetical protein ARAM_000558 [Aspergillus rambellii]|uniref:Enoyl reductase (ER) domain-containing protein n=1 Tax=Aspergillus rambellii TaxID=308745 RepID=A0A0F8UQY4_9EURO|nr:hypothetical protein ARAM_000558 [Aspergillus rambellii]